MEIFNWTRKRSIMAAASTNYYKSVCLDTRAMFAMIILATMLQIMTLLFIKQDVLMEV